MDGPGDNSCDVYHEQYFPVTSARNGRNLSVYRTRLFQVASDGLQPNKVRRGLDHFVKVNVGLVIAS